MALKFTINLPASPAKDVARREMNVKISNPADGTTKSFVDTLAADATIYQIALYRDLTVELFLVDVDTSGNSSKPSPTLAFRSVDTFPPPPPGELTIVNVEEEV